MPLLGLVLVLVLAAFAAMLWLRDHGVPRSASVDRVFVPDESLNLAIDASTLATGEPIVVELALRPEEIGDTPLTASLRSGGRTYDVGAASLDPATGKARLSIDAARLPPGRHLLAVRVADGSWNPNRRIAITVTEDGP